MHVPTCTRWDIRAASCVSPISRKERQTTKDEELKGGDEEESRITISSFESWLGCRRFDGRTRYSVIRDDHLVITRFVFRLFIRCVSRTQLARFNASLTLNASLQGTVFQESNYGLADRVNYRQTRNIPTSLANYNSIKPSYGWWAFERVHNLRRGSSGWRNWFSGKGVSWFPSSMLLLVLLVLYLEVW